jgi:hypothetical protein
MKKNCSGPTKEQPRLDKNLLYRHDKPNKPTKERPLSFALFESPFTSVSTVNRGQPSLVSQVFNEIPPASSKNLLKFDTGRYVSNGCKH